MANYLVAQIKSEVEAGGLSIVTFEAMEFANEAPFADADELVAAVDAFVASKDWLTSYTIDHARETILFRGPVVPAIP